MHVYAQKVQSKTNIANYVIIHGDTIGHNFTIRKNTPNLSKRFSKSKFVGRTIFFYN